MKKLAACLTVLLLSGTLVFSREPKEYDGDVIYDEGKIPHYDLPPLLATAEGRTIETAEEWRNIRRPQILALFANLVYGSVPKPQTPVKVEFEVKKTDPKFMGGKATRKDVQIRLSNDKGKAEMLVLVFVPNKAAKPAPAFMKHSFNDTKSRDFDVHPMWPGRLRNGWPLGKFFDLGYGFVAVYQQDLVGHNEVEFLKGIHRLFYRKGQSFPKAHEWGVLSAVAWGAMRAMDYLSAYHASEVYRLLGKKGLISETSPPVGEAIIESDVGYHIRKGGHSIEMYDWGRFLDFADYHLKK